MQESRTHLLFVCARNQWRSPTGEQLYRNDPRVAVRSRGVSPKARQRLTASDLEWADLVLVMESEHRARLRQQFPEEGRDATIHVLDIPDDYAFMDEELVVLLKESVEALL